MKVAIIKYLVAGVGINVSLAWILVLAQGRPVYDSDWSSIHNPRGDDHDPIVIMLQAQYGRACVTGMSRPGTFRDQYPELLSRYRGPVWWPDEAATFNDTWDYAVAGGWPMLSFRAWRTWDGVDKFSINRGIVIRGKISDGEPMPLVLPLQPIFAGLVWNSLFWASFSYFCITSYRFAIATHRGREGRCAHCGYPRSDSPVCVECGERLS